MSINSRFVFREQPTKCEHVSLLRIISIYKMLVYFLSSSNDYLFRDFETRWSRNATVTQGGIIYMHFAKIVSVTVRIAINSKIAEKENFRRYSDNLELCNEMTNRCKTSIFEDRDSSTDRQH